jgi:phosphonate transport system substrate-binding protein
MKCKFYIVVSLLFTTILSAKALVFGVVPQQSSIELAETWKPVVAYLEKTTGEKIHLKIERSIPEFEQALYSGEYDFAYMNPYHYIVAHKRIKYQAIARDIKKLVGIIVVHKESGIQHVSELKGKEFLFPAPDAFAATLLTKYDLLKEHGIDIERDKKFRYVNSHDSVYKGVARHIGDAGGGIERTFNNLGDSITKASLKIIYKTDAYPSHPFAFHPALPQKVQERLTEAIITMSPSLLEPLSMKQIIQTHDSEYNTVRRVGDALPSLQNYR